MNSALQTINDHGRRRHDLLLSLLLFVIVLCFYWPVTSFAFLNFDDPIYITDNPMVLGGLTWSGVQWAFTTFTMGHWHPLTWISHQTDISLFGLNPWGHHLVNLIFFAMNIGLVFLLFRSFRFSKAWAYVGALFFALHPLRLESFAWVAERKDVLSFFFGMISLLLYLKYSKASELGETPVKEPFKEPAKKNPYLIFSMLAFFLSLLAKPTFVSLPVLIVLYELCIRNQRKWLTLLSRVMGFALPATASSLLVLFSQNQEGALKTISILERFHAMAFSYLAYFIKFFWPWEVAVFYPRKPAEWSLILIGLFCFILLSLYFFKSRKSNSYLWYGWTWFLVTALPLSGIIPIGGQAYADRWTLLPHLGLILMCLSLLSKIRWPRFAFSFSAAVLAGMAYFTLLIMPTWQNSETLFRHALRVDPDNFMAHNNLGVALAASGREDEAIPHYEAAVQLNPTYPEALNNLGSSRARKARYLEAIALFQRALTRDPNLNSARFNLGLAYVSDRKYTEGIKIWISLLALNQEETAARNYLRQFALSSSCEMADWKLIRKDAAKVADQIKNSEDREILELLQKKVCS